MPENLKKLRAALLRLEVSDNLPKPLGQNGGKLIYYIENFGLVELNELDLQAVTNSSHLILLKNEDIENDS